MAARVSVAATTEAGSRDQMEAQVSVAATTEVGSRNSMAARMLFGVKDQRPRQDSVVPLRPPVVAPLG